MCQQAAAEDMPRTLVVLLDTEHAQRGYVFVATEQRLVFEGRGQQRVQ